MMESIDLANGYKITQLYKQDIDTVEELCNKCSDYYILSGGALPTKDDVSALFTELPPNKNLEDKILLGVYKSNKLIGIIDIIRDYPIKSEWTIGLLLLEPEERGKGLGAIIHEALIKRARHLGAKRFSIGVIEDNNKAFSFWSKLGYEKIRDINMDIGSKKQEVKLMRLELYTKLIMVRHAKVEYTPDDNKRALSKEGEEQKKDVFNILKDKEIDIIYSSPYIRAIETIKPYAEYKKKKIHIVDDLRERKVSDHFIDDFDTFAIKQWEDFNYKLPYGESLREVQERGVKAIEEIVRDNKGKTILIGTHGTFLGILLNYHEKSCDYKFCKSLQMPAIISIILDSQGLAESIYETKLDGKTLTIK